MVITVTDASHCRHNETHDEIGLVSRLKINLDSGLVFHGTCWSSVKQQKFFTLRLVRKYLLLQMVTIATTLLRQHC